MRRTRWRARLRDPLTSPVPGRSSHHKRHRQVEARLAATLIRSFQGIRPSSFPHDTEEIERLKACSRYREQLSAVWLLQRAAPFSGGDVVEVGRAVPPVLR